MVHLKAMKQKDGKWGIFRVSSHVLILVIAVVFAVGQFVPWSLFTDSDSDSDS